MKKIKLFTIYLFMFLVLCYGFVIAMVVFKYGYLNENAEHGTILYITYLALVTPMLLNFLSGLKNLKTKKTKIITGKSYLDLQINLNNRLEEMRRKTIIDVQLTGEFCALIVYTD